jgi:hypothetical protein
LHRASRDRPADRPRGQKDLELFAKSLSQSQLKALGARRDSTRLRPMVSSKKPGGLASLGEKQRPVAAVPNAQEPLRLLPMQLAGDGLKYFIFEI